MKYTLLQLCCMNIKIFVNIFSLQYFSSPSASLPVSCSSLLKWLSFVCFYFLMKSWNFSLQSRKIMQEKANSRRLSTQVCCSWKTGLMKHIWLLQEVGCYRHNQRDNATIDGLLINTMLHLFLKKGGKPGLILTQKKPPPSPVWGENGICGTQQAMRYSTTT